MARQKKKRGSRKQSANTQAERTQENGQNDRLVSNRTNLLFPVYAVGMLLIAVFTGYLMYQSAQHKATGAPITESAARQAPQE